MSASVPIASPDGERQTFSPGMKARASGRRHWREYRSKKIYAALQDLQGPRTVILCHGTDGGSQYFATRFGISIREELLAISSTPHLVVVPMWVL
ncbi:hypothetical protein [Desulfurispira natronophila]|uniref:Uncharacterized protein n=1 Tax=Desulfurispira natronophila TaxID=682562 RepID=A0A7W7Y5H6_9BACT|nr:hypothetical protein [Desulfurispira natronophila]MBB5022448.1 hypothetical protein [Desulfurispira natronophila]